MTDQIVKHRKPIAVHGFVTYTQEIIAAAQEGYILDISNRGAPQFSLGLFQANMLLLEDAPAEVVEEQVVPNLASNEIKPKATRMTKAKAALIAKLPQEALAPSEQ